MKSITIALAKGRLADKATELLTQAGYDCRVLQEDSRKLIFTNGDGSLRFIMAKPADVPTYVESGVADVGVAGKDTLLEDNRNLFEVLDLDFGACRLAVCGPIGFDLDDYSRGKLRVATKYPNVSRRYFAAEKHEAVEIIKLNGSIELAPLVGLSDVIVDIVESGRTLKENKLDVLETVAACSARMVVNQASMKLKAEEISTLIRRLRRVLGQDKERGV